LGTLVHIGGRICPPDEAKVSVFDRGFLYGDSVYETVSTMYGRLFALAEHLARLERSAARIGLRAPARATIERAVAETVQTAANPESRVRVMLTRGVGKLDLDPASADDPQLIVVVMPFQPLPPALYQAGASAAIVSVVRNDPRAIDPAIKSGNYLNNVLALGEARRQGAHEALLCAADGSVAEGASSNIFMVKDGQVRTPGLDVGILEGITRAQVLALARGDGIPTHETRLLPGELRGADEAFITSATRAVLPVTRIDGAVIGDGRPGPITRRLMQLLDQLARDGVA
jgi:branched-chain amino acid aminotransferase